MSTRSMGVAGTEIDPKNPKKCRIGQQKARNFMRSAQRMLVRIAICRIIQSKPGTERLIHNYKIQAFKYLKSRPANPAVLNTVSCRRLLFRFKLETMVLNAGSTTEVTLTSLTTQTNINEIEYN